MWTTLALMSALSWTPAQAGQLQLKNARVTHGILGQERKDTTYLPGDMVVLAFDIEGLEVKDDGRVTYSMSMELYDHKKKKVVFQQKQPQQMTVVNTLGGSRLPSFALTNVGTDTEAGKYTMTVRVKDGGGKEAKLDQDFEVKKLEFGIVRPGFVYNKLNEEQAGPPTQVAPPLAVPGQNLMLNFAVVGFKLNNKEQPNVTVSMKVLDDSGSAVLKTPFNGKANNIDDELKKLGVIPFQVPIQVNRSGKFKIVLTATDDNDNNKTVQQTLDLKVIENN